MIDGYNLLHVIDKRTDPESLSDKRETLLLKLNNYQAEKNVGITVVFDGVSSALFQKRDKRGEVEIVYTEDHMTADDYIKKECRRNPGYVVVTNDLDIVANIEAAGCLSLSSEEFVKRLELNQKKTAPVDPYLEDKEGEDGPDSLYPRVSTKKKGVAKKLPKRERRKQNQLKNL